MVYLLEIHGQYGHRYIKKESYSSIYYQNYQNYGDLVALQPYSGGILALLELMRSARPALQCMAATLVVSHLKRRLCFRPWGLVYQWCMCIKNTLTLDK
jgi:hypothetical protein